MPPLRDLTVTGIVFASLPIILKRPWVGVLMWIWLSVMNPHRLSWGFAYDLPFAQMVGIALLIGFLCSKEPKRMPWSALVVVWVLFVGWMCVTTVFAYYPDWAMNGLERSLKIQIPTFLALMIMYTRERLNMMVWVLTLSLAYFGTKGGVFTIMHGGEFLVWGPPQSFINGNNELALALVTVIPLLWFMHIHAQNKWVRRALLASLLLCIASVIGSSSRGAFLAGGAMGMFLLWKSPKRAPILAGLIVVVPLILALAPAKYWDRMNTIQNYQEDDSATGRLNAWQFAINLASDYPITGAGFAAFNTTLFNRYAPDPSKVLVAHSNYFQVLAEHGYVGLFLYLMMLLLAWRAASWTIRAARREGDALRWHGDLARMCQVALVGYSLGGAFLSLTYFDLYYYIVAIIVLNRRLAAQLIAQRAGTAAPAAQPGARAVQGVPPAIASVPMRHGPGR